VLEALHTDPDTFNSTLVILNYDENDGQFDHVPPPVPAPDARDEWFDPPITSGPGFLLGGNSNAVPVGLGFRVPLVLVSPWTRGGWVTSEVADHTSVIQLMEKWTAAHGKPAICPNISEWRRRVCGDLTRAFDFSAPVYGLPKLPKADTVIGNPPGDAYSPPVVSNAMPKQEAGTKRARPLPVQPNANLEAVTVAADGLHVELAFSNNGRHVDRASHFAVYNNAAINPAYGDYPKHAPGQHTIDPVRGSADRVVTVDVDLPELALPGRYDVTVVGPNRFLRNFTGNLVIGNADARATAAYYPHGLHHEPVLDLELANAGEKPVTFTIATNHYARRRTDEIAVAAGGKHHHVLEPLKTSHGWYDVTVTISGDPSWSRRYVGHLETGKPSITGA
jgi:phospholipase C